MPKSTRITINSPLPYTIKDPKITVIGTEADNDAAKKLNLSIIRVSHKSLRTFPLISPGF